VDARLLSPQVRARAPPRRVANEEVAMTRNTLLRLQLLMLLAMTAAGCEIAEGIFKAGVWVGVLLVVVIVGVIFMLFGRSRT
jgi:uncharacterized membrane protein YkvI